MAGKCCCAPQIDASKNQIISAIKSSAIKQQGLPRSSIEIPVEAIARRVAELLNPPPKNNFESQVINDLDSIKNALIALRSRENLETKVNQILRNQLDIELKQQQYQRETRDSFAMVATREQAKDLLFAITDRSREVLKKINDLQFSIDVKLAGILAAIAALSAFVFAQNKLVLAAVSASLLRILAAISGIRFKPEPVDLDGAVRKINDEIRKNALTMELASIQVPRCGVSPTGEPIVESVKVEYGAIKDAKNRSQEQLFKAMGEVLYGVRTQGILECSGNAGMSSEEVVRSMDEEDPNKVLFGFPLSLEASYFVLEVDSWDASIVRTYKLAGGNSEFGAGNWSLCNQDSSASLPFFPMFNQFNRLDVPTGTKGWGVRVSPKAGVSFRVTAFGRPIL